MVVKKVNRLCSVKGCKNTQSYAISRSNEYGGVIICKECLKSAFDAAEKAESTGQTKVKTNSPQAFKNAALFFHPEDKAVKSISAQKSVKEKTKSEAKII